MSDNEPKSLDDFACAVFPVCAGFHSVGQKNGPSRAAAIKDSVNDAYEIAKLMRSHSRTVSLTEAAEEDAVRRLPGRLSELQRPGE